MLFFKHYHLIFCWRCICASQNQNVRGRTLEAPRCAVSSIEMTEGYSSPGRRYLVLRSVHTETILAWRAWSHEGNENTGAALPMESIEIQRFLSRCNWGLRPLATIIEDLCVQLGHRLRELVFPALLLDFLSTELSARWFTSAYAINITAASNSGQRQVVWQWPESSGRFISFASVFPYDDASQSTWGSTVSTPDVEPIEGAGGSTPLDFIQDIRARMAVLLRPVVCPGRISYLPSTYNEQARQINVSLGRPTMTLGAAESSAVQDTEILSRGLTR